jgi:hypothetical protein
MTEQSITQRTELAQRSSNGLEVTLVWVHGDNEDKTVVSVHDEREGTSFEIRVERHLALDAYYHPFAYRTLGGEASLFAGAVR